MANEFRLTWWQNVGILQGKEETKKNSLMFVETSVKVGYNVSPTLFKRISQALPGMEGTDAAQGPTTNINGEKSERKQDLRPSLSPIAQVDGAVAENKENSGPNLAPRVCCLGEL
ncbi:hypothetical protein B0H66DRAFT_396079 [Apodospora peruviana]|uniref:Uncharacterized protein n=1 Tax=Apodospora peruviana TaxID=516989 RepID=A0AAE0HSV3_9PEZI|nr:hypothetical protein B0H66DRAFT_396079 [Apodospora peruviana]